ncbi:MAG TPA: anti-sigma factor [Solirubrobacteraceae bacterium]|jgi:hypothetical protein|nr:anti-sigma factor [Solirubrobacteraceae bacterium]
MTRNAGAPEDARASPRLRRRVLADVNRRDARWRRNTTAGLLTAAALAAAGIVIAVGNQRAPMTHDQRTFARLIRTDGRAELVVRGMVSPPIGETYEVWLIRGEQPPRATDILFTVTSGGGATVDLGRMDGVREVIVTAEPLGGSRTPSTAPVLRASVPRAV